MKQASVKLPSGDYLIQGLPDGAYWVEMNNPYTDEIVYALGNQDDKTIKIPPGTWQLLGADPTALTEEEAGEIVEPLFTKDDINRDGRYHYEFDLNPMPYKNYLWNTKLDDGSQYSSVDQPTASLDSLAQSLGISKPYVILKNKTDNNDKP